ncbi:MAG: hypothetical protein VX017_11270, partial [Pseudomonadota bacterium]|nr:hypothetical protein [Pseudomonadota bacterium]
MHTTDGLLALQADDADALARIGVAPLDADAAASSPRPGGVPNDELSAAFSLNDVSASPRAVELRAADGSIAELTVHIESQSSLL